MKFGLKDRTTWRWSVDKNMCSQVGQEKTKITQLLGRVSLFEGQSKA